MEGIVKKFVRFGVVFYLALTCIALFLTFYTHKNVGYYNWKSEIWADKAGYYIYLPSLFMYQFDATKAPEKIDEKVGYGFTLDMEKKTINTKYTYGVAALISPFFIIARLISPILQVPGEGGFSPVFHKAVNFAAVFYLIFGLILLRRFLENYFKKSTTYITIFFIFAGTNLFYYTVNDTLMSHVYSFFIFSLFLYSLKKFLLEPQRLIYFLVLSFAFGMAILIRPTNILLLLLFFVWDVHSFREIVGRIGMILHPKRLVSFLAIVVLIFLPQMIYWKYSRGSWISWSYANEGFTNWNQPKILEVWFSTLNGLFLYTPFVVLILIGMVLMLRKKLINGLTVVIFFLMVSYIASAWYNWYFGCSFGQRSFVEYMALFAVPFGFFVEAIPNLKNLLIRTLVLFLLLALSYYNIRMSLEFEKCFFGSTWDWDQFAKQVDRSKVFRLYERPLSFQNDFENQALSYAYQTSDSIFHGGMYSARMAPEKEFTSVYWVSLHDLGEVLPKYITVDYYAYNPGQHKVEAFLICSIEKNDTAIAWQSKPLPPLQRKPAKWEKISTKFIIPDNLTREPSIKIYFWNPNKSLFYIDDLTLQFKK